MSDNPLFQLHHLDARKISELITTPIVDVVITSPPYFDMKDYGYSEQIGYGQDYETYLNDLQDVFAHVYNCVKDTGSLWVVIDTLRRNNSILPLPFDFAARLTKIGWKFQEIIIWGKDKTVPWSQNGQMRRLFEYILVFSKTDQYNFYIDTVRQYDTLKKWWIKYPERYNPRGKTPEAIWNFPIPVQGAWGQKYIRHFCPLPEELIAQIIKLTTKEGDVVLDPFAGSGAVLAKADNMKRYYIGTELNPDYINMFHNYLHATGDKKRKQYEQDVTYKTEQKIFEKCIIELRALKYIRILHKKMALDIQEVITRYYIPTPIILEISSKAIASVICYIECKNQYVSQILNEIETLSQQQQLKTFQLEVTFKFVDRIIDILDSTQVYYTYTKSVTHKFHKSITIGKMEKLLNYNDLIISDIILDIDEKNFEE